MDYLYYLICVIIILFVAVSIFWLYQIIKRIPLLIQYKKEIKKIEENASKAMDAKTEEIKERCVRDISISDDDLEQVVLCEIKIACNKIVEDGKEKLRLLELNLIEKCK